MPRIPSLDLARGFTVFIMPSVHVLLLYGSPSTHQHFLGRIFVFLAEGPGATLFMLLMGVSFVLSSRINKRTVLERAFYLLLAAYQLNFFKFIIPLLAGTLPDNLLQELGLPNDPSSALFFFLLGDILHFASISLPILFLVYQLKHYAYWSVFIAIAIMLLSPYVWDVKTEFVFVDWLLQLTGGQPPTVFFPLFPWLVYPLIGMSLGYFLKHHEVHYILRKAGVVGTALLIFSLGLPTTTGSSFYRTKYPDTLFHLGFVLLWLAIIYWLARKFKINLFSKLLMFCSKHITTIYIIQWVAIFWCLAFTGYQQLNLLPVICWMTGMTVFSLLFTYALHHAQPKSL